MAKQPYNKPAFTIDEQLQQLIDRGMIIDDHAKAKHFLSELNYYRLGAYWLPFEIDHNTHQFKPGTTFEQVLERYDFDRGLRLLLLDAIERVEVSVRTQMAYHLSHKYGSHFHLDRSLYKGKWDYNFNRQKVEKEVFRSKETFIKHLKIKYNEPLPPIWAMVEIMTLGQLSSWYANLKSGADRNLVAHHYDFDETVFVSFLHHLSIVRNLCAHHSRLWNRAFTFKTTLPNYRPNALITNLNTEKPRNIYNTLTILAYLLDCVCSDHHWKQRIHDLIMKHNIPTEQMGFPTNWLQLNIWKSINF